MKHTTSESDVTSLATSSPPRTPKTPNKRPAAAYYVQSPSQSHGDDADNRSSTSRNTTPVYNNSPLESPSHPSSTGRHSRISSSAGTAATRYSGYLRSSSSPGASGRNKRLKGLWREVDDAIDEEAADGDGIDGEQEEAMPSRLCVVAFWLAVPVLVLALVCLVVWGAARHYKPSVIVKSLTVHNLYVGEGTDRTGVPTKLATLNCSLILNVHNPSTMFGIHVSSGSSRLMYSQISIADGQFQKFYQPRTSHRVASVVLHGDKTPLYGAGATLDLSADSGGAVPLTLELAVRTRGYVIGKLVRVSHARHVKCPVVIYSGSSRPVRFRQSACSYT